MRHATVTPYALDIGANGRGCRVSTADRVLSVLGLFTIEAPEWTVEEAARALGLSNSTAYEYFRSLVEAGLLVASKAGRYSVGPAIIELDRVTRRFDPLTNAASGTLRDLVADLEVEAIGLLCRIYRLKVMCVDQYVRRPPTFAISYERGRPMPLGRGAASKIILANLAPRPLRRFYDGDPAAVAAAGLGDSWDAFKRTVRQIRKPGVLATVGELDAGLMGISAPVFGAGGDVLGSIGLVVSAADFLDHPARLEATMAAVRLAGEDVTGRLQAE
ncbi:IclR family transcriptional regulator [Nitrospirillum viridazoti]|uniref:IclR family transcriptional regulator n=1 Tax=Nitrospirillum amazonense TaxID=28077 RepID=A0A560HII3_9PROT|nr:IclR family transcriptional regulator [Nitrospirillum amazonense]TWB64452.1 IclR family transcriptional regulator [Nitrospirillum amazonense]